MQLKFLGAAQEVGKSGILLTSKQGNVVMDFGLKVENVPPEHPMLPDVKVDGVVISHSHLDHCGAVPMLHAHGFRGPTFGTSVTLQVAKILLNDSIKIAKLEGYPQLYTPKHVEMMNKNEFAVPYRKPFKIGQVDAQLFDAGHIPGSAFTYLETEGKSVMYTGDMKVDSTHLVDGCEMDLPKVDTLIIESTYAQREHPDRKQLEKRLVEEIKATLDEKGHILIPAFAVGRSQELLMILYNHGLLKRVFLDGMGKSVLATYLNFPGYIKHAKELKEIEKKINWVYSQKERMELLKHPSIIVSSAGMLEGGPARYYLEQIYKEPQSKILLTGYQVEDTAGRILLDERKLEVEIGKKEDVHAQVDYFDFSAHAGRSELLRFIKHVNPENVVCVHGGNTQLFADDLNNQGFNAVAPKIGEILKY